MAIQLTMTLSSTFYIRGIRSFLSKRPIRSTGFGEPNLDPEIDISYEIGLRNQISANDAFNISAFGEINMILLLLN